MRLLLMQPWSERDLEVLVALLQRRQPVRQIAWKLRRTQSAVRTKIVKLGLSISRQTETVPQMRRAVFRKGPLEKNA